jgi:hypothetical protein
VRKRLFSHNRGFATVNDGPAFASQLARYLNSRSQDPHPATRLVERRCCARVASTG